MPSMPLDRYDLDSIARFLKGLEALIIETDISPGPFEIYHMGEEVGQVDNELNFVSREVDVI